MIPVEVARESWFAEFVGADGLGDIGIAIYAGLMASWSAAASAQQMLPPSGSGMERRRCRVTRALPQPNRSRRPMRRRPRDADTAALSAPATMQIRRSAQPGRSGYRSLWSPVPGLTLTDPNGLVWRVFPAKPDVTGAFRAVKGGDRLPVR